MRQAGEVWVINQFRHRPPDGWEVYSQYFDLWEEDEENLPDDGVGRESIPVRLLWEGEPGLLGALVVPPLKKRKAKSRDS